MSRNVLQSEGVVSLSPLAKGGDRGVVERGMPEDFGLEFTPPYPPFARGGLFRSLSVISSYA